jgi:hypothetical protein
MSGSPERRGQEDGVGSTRCCAVERAGGMISTLPEWYSDGEVALACRPAHLEPDRPRAPCDSSRQETAAARTR